MAIVKRINRLEMSPEVNQKQPKVVRKYGKRSPVSPCKGNKKYYKFSVVLSEEEAKRIDDSLSLSGIKSRSKYLKSLIFQSSKELYFHQFQKLIFEINRIGRNINQLARIANQANQVEMFNELKAYKKQVDNQIDQLMALMVKLSSNKK